MSNIDQLYSEWLSLQPLKPEDKNRLDRKFMLEFNYNSNHIEGNTLTYGQTELLLLFGRVVDEANMKDLEEMKAHNVCLKMVQEEANDKSHPLTETFIRQLHHTLLREDYTMYRQLPDGTTTSYVIHAGVYKTRPNSVITVTGERFEYASPEETPALMTDLVEWYNMEEQKAELSPIELATVFHYRYIRIHPFEDGNGRISRLLVNYILTRHGYPMLVVKSKDKSNYLTALNRCDVAVGSIPSVGARAEIKQLEPFITYMSKCLERALLISIKAAHGESIDEVDDWKKSLKLKYRDKLNKPALTNEFLDNVLNKVYQPLLNRIDSELSEFYSIFSSFIWEPDVAKYVFDKNNNTYISTMTVTKPTMITTATRMVAIRLIVQQFVYKIDISLTNGYLYYDSLYNKEFSYLESLSEQDEVDIVNMIGRFLNVFIESNDPV
ncbi:Fic family protein [Bacteroides caecicola]|uniref:Fic family protein n=1 Tax=Bacteroides caecicola TaxID=1462569 RepID=A0ABS2F663_9BACE|nr:Fic family protein [Bacteroides caecicola]MBM6805309.1 Fic family protein [Bacteroides caecicola]